MWLPYSEKTRMRHVFFFCFICDNSKTQRTALSWMSGTLSSLCLHKVWLGLCVVVCGWAFLWWALRSQTIRGHFSFPVCPSIEINHVTNHMTIMACVNAFEEIFVITVNMSQSPLWGMSNSSNRCQTEEKGRKRWGDHRWEKEKLRHTV